MINADKSGINGLKCILPVFKNDKNMEAIVEEFGSWAPQTGIHDNRSTRIISRQRKNQFGKQFVSSTVILSNDSLNHMDDYMYEKLSGRINSIVINLKHFQ